MVLVLVIVFWNIRCGHRGIGLRSSFHYVYVYGLRRWVELSWVPDIELRLLHVGFPTCRHSLFCFFSCFDVNGSRWCRKCLFCNLGLVLWDLYKVIRVIIEQCQWVGLKSDGTTGQTTGHLAARGSASCCMARRKAGDWTDDGIGLLHVIRLCYSIFSGGQTSTLS